MANDQSNTQNFSQTLSLKFAMLTEKLQEQVWFQQLKTKWDELDPQNRLYLKLGSLGGSFALLFFFLIAMMVSVRGLKQEFAEKTDLLTLIQASSEEIRTLKDANAGVRIAAPPNWRDFFEQVTAGAGLDKSALAVGDEQVVTSKESSKESRESGAIQESLFELKVNHANIKQVVKFAYQVENSGQLVRLRSLTIDTKNDPSGYLDSVVSVSAFSQVPAGIGKGAEK